MADSSGLRRLFPLLLSVRPASTAELTASNYIAAWTDVSGRRLKRSTKTTDKKLAANLARAFEDAATASKTASSLSLETGVETRSRGLFRDKCGK